MKVKVLSLLETEALSFRPLAGKWSMKVVRIKANPVYRVSVPLRGNGQ